MVKDKKELGQSLRNIRKAKGMTQLQVSEKMNVHRSTYTYYEIGKCDISATKLVEICEILETDPNTLLGF